MTKGWMILGIVFLAVWGTSLYYRCSDRTIRRRLITLVGLFIFWFILVLVRYSIDDAWLSSILWYLFYVPMIFAPALCLSMAFRASSLEHRPHVRAFEAVVFVLCGIFAVMILTNNWHQLAFIFDTSSPDWSFIYSYGPLYWIVAVAIVAMFLGFVGILAFSSRKQLLSGMPFLVTLIAMGVLYCILYVLKMDLPFTKNFTLFYICTVCIAVELCLDFGLFPSFLWYKDVFYGLPLDIKLLSFEGEVVCATTASGLSAETRAEIREHIKSDSDETSFIDERNPDKMFRLQRLSGGYALLAEDLSEVNREQKWLEQLNATLTRQNEMLQREHGIDSSLRQAELERNLLAQIESSLGDTVETIIGLLDEAKDISADKNQGERFRILALARILTAYCKRKGSLIISENNEEDFNAERLRVILNETMGDLRSIGIDCAALVETNRSLPATTTNILYGCFYDLIVRAFFCESPVIMLFLSDGQDDAVELRVLLECDPKDNASWKTWCDDLGERLTERGVEHHIEASDDSVKLTVVVRYARKV